MRVESQRMGAGPAASRARSCRARRLAILLAGMVLAAGVPPAAASEAAVARLRAAIDAAVAPYLAATDFMGVVAVERDGQPPLVLTYGRASVELDVPHRPDGSFRIGSVSKQFTAAAVLLLEQEGRLTTGDRVARHLPEFRHGAAITIEQLLTHTAGVADIYSLPSFGRTAGRDGSFDEVVAELGRMELTHPPGSAFAYSNGGYAVLAAIIERASGTSYGDYLARRIFEPLGMERTAHDGPAPAVAGRVPGYDPWGRDGLTPAVPVSPAFTCGSGSLWSTAGDLLVWARALHGGRLLSPPAYARMTRDHGHGYGYGVSVFRRFGREVVGHDGRVAGYASDLASYLEDGVTVAVLGNVQSVARDEIRRGVAAAVLSEPYEPPPRPRWANPPPEPPVELSGSYRFGPGFVVTLRAADGRLLARANQGGESELVALADGAWFSRMLYATVRFGRGEDGAVDRLVWGAGEGAPVGHRLP